MKIKTRDFASGRTSDGRVYSAMGGTETVVDDDDEGMVALMKQLAASGVVDIVKDEPEPEAEAEPELAPEAEAETEAETEAEPAAESAAEGESDADWYQSRTVVELRDLARERSLQVSGSKDELVARLMEGGE